MTTWSPDPSLQRPSVDSGPRPMTVADILDVTFTMLRRNWKPIGLVTLIFSAPGAVLTFLFYGVLGVASSSEGFGDIAAEVDSEGILAGFLAAFLAYFAVMALTSLLVEPFVKGIIARIIAASYLGRQMDLKSAAKGVFRLWPALIGASFIAISAYSLAFLVSLTLFFLLCLLFLPLLAVWVLFTAANPAIVIEEIGPIQGLQRSWSLMKRRFWPYLLIRLLVLLVVSTLSYIVAIPMKILVLVFGFAELPLLEAAANSLGTILGTLITIPVVASITTLLYFDARVRFEAFEVQLMAAGLAGGSPSYPVPPSPPQDAGWNQQGPPAY